MVLEGLLNSNQLKAATTFSGPVMVFAGAGSGKTRTLTYRIANMIENGIPPYNILAITFTKKATNEMKERLFSLISSRAKYITISTFHALCARILRQEIQILGYKKDFNILDEEDQLKVINDVLEQNNIDKKKFTAKASRKNINFCKCFNTKPSSPIEQIIFNKYEEMMKELNALDFQDLLLKTYELFKISSETLEKYRSKFQYILVDEFQDTDLVQYKLLKLLSINTRNIFVVGDDDQSIYSFRGTNYENMELFKKDFPEYQIIILDENYRSTQTILDGANKLIAHNDNREKKKMFSQIQGLKEDVVIMQLHDERDEVNYVIEQIKARVRNENKSYSDFAILYRSTVISRNFELGMIQNNLPYRIFGGVSYLRRKEVKDIIAYFKLILDNDDIISFSRIVNEPSRSLGIKTIQTVIDFKRQYKISLFDAIDALKSVIPSKYKILKSFKDMILEFKSNIDDIPLVDTFNAIIEKTDYMSIFEDDEAAKDRKENLIEFKSILNTIDNNGEIATRSQKLIEAFDEAILSDDKLQNQQQKEDGITLSTVHSVKGLEFDTVFVVAFEEGIFPSMFSFLDNVDEEEERRIAYVAVTRAKSKLYLTCSTRRLIYGDIRRNPQSHFLLEFIGSSHSKPFKKKDKYEYDISQVEDEKPFEVSKGNKDIEEEVRDTNYKIGDYIIHKVYGEGIIVSLDNTTGKICFTSKGEIKTFDMTHPAIRKKNG